VFRDPDGFSVMSTACTYDLTPLVRKVSPEGRVTWESQTTSSKYDERGQVISGPATVRLPFYQLRADRALPSGPIDTLFAFVGVEKDPSWRFSLTP
jgi:hypothetical protein